MILLDDKHDNFYGWLGVFMICLGSLLYFSSFRSMAWLVNGSKHR